MNNKTILAAIFIAVLTTSATYCSPSAALSSPQRQNTAPTVLTIPTDNVKYEVNGTFYAYVNLTSFKVIIHATGLPFSSINITIPEFYVGIRISVAAKNIVFNLTDPAHPYVKGDVSVNAMVTIRYDLYFNYTGPGSKGFHRSDSLQKGDSAQWTGRWFIPWGTTKNFTMPFPMFELSATEPNATTPQPQAGIKFTNENLTGSDTSWTVTHTTWDFGDWVKEKVNNTLNGFATAAMQNIVMKGFPGIQMGFTVPTSVGKVDLWKANATKGATTIPNVLLMASALINLLFRYFLVGHGTFTGNIGGHSVTLNYDINVGADFGMFFSLIVLSDLGHQVLTNYEISDFLVEVPENATLSWRKIGVIVYYGSPAHGCDVTGGVAQGYWSYPDGQHKLFFVDYGWDGTPDFLTNGTTESGISHPTATVSGTTFPFTVQLDKTAGGWLYFSLPLPSQTDKSSITVKRSDGVTVNSTQYWIQDNVLYVCDDPTYTYTVSLVTSGPGGISPFIIVGALAVVVVLVLALVLVRRRGAKPTNVTIK